MDADFFRILSLRSDGVFSFNTIDGNRATVDCYAVTASVAETARYVRNSGGQDMRFYWDGQSGQPQWLWGSNDGVNIKVWNPSSFSVNYANSAGSAPANGGTATATVTVPNIAFGDNSPVPAGGTWGYFSYGYSEARNGVVAGGTNIPWRWIAIKMS